MKKKLTVFICFLLIAGIVSALVFSLKETQRENEAFIRYGEAVTKYCFEYNVDANLVFAVIKAESNFYEKAVSGKGAIGLMQIMPATAKYIAELLKEEYSGELLYNYADNIRYGTFYLKYLFGKYKEIDIVIAAYNAGEGNINSWLKEYSEDGKTLKEIPFEETKKYLFKVKRYYGIYKNEYNY